MNTRATLGVMVLVLASYVSAELSWTLRSPSLSNHAFEQVLWDGAQYIAFGGNQVVATSPDGDDWTPHKVPFTYFQQAASSGKVTVAVDAGILVSSDGVNWESVTLPSKWCCFNSIFWTGKRFLLNGVFEGVDSIAISEDGKSWSLSSLGGPTMGSAQSYAVSGDTVVMAGQGGIFYSFDHGLKWSPVVSSPPCVGLVRVSGVFLAVTQDGRILTSSSGVGWVDRSGLVDTLNALSGRTDQSWSEAGYLDGKIFLAGATFFESSNLANWSENTSLLSWWSMARASSPTRKRNLTYANQDLFMFGAGGVIWGRRHGEDWSLRSRAVTLHHLKSVAVGAGVWIAVGDSGTIVRSTDGKSWSRVEVGCGADLSKVLFAQGKFRVLGDSGVVLSSQDGSSWIRSSVGATVKLLDAIWVDSIKILIADSNRVFSSTDGDVWSNALLTAGNRIRLGAKSPKGFLLVGTRGLSFFSAEGKSWTPNGDDALFRTPEAISWNGNEFILASQGKLYASEDGSTWRSMNESFDARVNQLTMSGGDLLVLLEDGRICRIRGDGASERIGDATGGIYAMSVTDSLLIQVGGFGSILSAPNQGAVEIRKDPRGVAGRFSFARGRLEFDLPVEETIRIVVAVPNGAVLHRLPAKRFSAGTHSLSLGNLDGVSILLIRVGNRKWETLKISPL